MTQTIETSPSDALAHRIRKNDQDAYQQLRAAVFADDRNAVVPILLALRWAYVTEGGGTYDPTKMWLSQLTLDYLATPNRDAMMGELMATAVLYEPTVISLVMTFAAAKGGDAGLWFFNMTIALRSLICDKPPK